MPEGLPKITSELNIPTRHNSLKQTMQFDDEIERDIGYSGGVKGSKAKQEMGHFRKWYATNTESCFLRIFGRPNTKSIPKILPWAV